MKVAIVGTYPAGTFEKFKNYFSEKPEIEVVEVDTQEKFDALTEADAIVLRILKNAEGSSRKDQRIKDDHALGSRF